MEHVIDRAARALGSQNALAIAVGVTKAAVWQWKSEGRKVPVEHCLAIERATNGAVTRRDLRPDDYWAIWPDLERTPAEVAEAKANGVNGRGANHV